VPESFRNAFLEAVARGRSVDRTVALVPDRSGQIDPVRSEENTPLAILQLDQLPRVVLHGGSDLNRHLYSGKEQTFPDRIEPFSHAGG
jgi:hypothetical protein